MRNEEITTKLTKHPSIVHQTAEIVESIVNGKESKLGSMFYRKMPLAALKEAIDNHPGSLTMPPAEAFISEIDGFSLTEESPQEYLIMFNLWFDDKRADLTLHLVFIDNSNHPTECYLDNCYVM